MKTKNTKNYTEAGMMLAYESNAATVLWDEASQSIHLTWKNFAQGEALRESLNNTLELIAANGGQYCLSDARDVCVLTHEDQQWMSGEWFPRASQLGLQYLAVLQPKNIIAKISVNAVLNRVDGIEIVTFDTIAAAKQWLTIKRITPTIPMENSHWNGILSNIDWLDKRNN